MLLEKKGELSEELEKYVAIGEKETIENIKACVEGFIHSHKLLEKLYIGRLEGFSFKWIKY